MPSGVQEELPGRPYGWVWRWSHRRHKLEWERNVSKCEPCVSSGKLCIEVTPQSKIVWISESLCIGCGICIKVILAPEYLAGNDLFTLLLVTTFKLLSVFEVCFVTFSPCRNVRLEHCRSSTFPATWRRKPHTDTAPTPSNCTGTAINLQSVYLHFTAEQCFLWHVTKTSGNRSELSSSVAVILGSLL